MNSTPQAILDALKQNRIVADNRLAQAKSWFAANPLPPNPVPGEADAATRFGQWLVANGIVTPFQLDFIQKGSAKRLRLDEYVLVDRIGQGRMAGVYKARHTGGHAVAVKVLPPSKAKDEEAFGRFQREGRLAARLKHPNVVRTFDMGEADGLHYIAMEYLEGETLEDVLKRRGKLSADEVSRLLHQSLEGLAHLHEQDVVHRDLKPGNLMLTSAPRPLASNPSPQGGEGSTSQSTVKLLDVGLGRTLFDDAPAGKVDLTEAGDLLGTVAYMAPEQARDARQADVRSDLYSLGCVFYQALVGQPPFTDKNATRLILMHATQALKPLREVDPKIPANLAGVIEKLLAKDPAQRFATPQAALKALNSAAPTAPAVQVVSASAPARTPPGAPATPTKVFVTTPVLAGLGGVGVLALVVLIVLLVRRNDPTPSLDKKGGDPNTKNVDKADPTKTKLADLREQLRHDDAGRRSDAVVALAGMGSAARPAYGDLVAVLNDSDNVVREQASTALAKLGPPTSADLPAIRAALRDPSPWGKSFAANALGSFGADAKDDFGYLRLLALDEDESVREASENAVAKLEPVVIGLLIKDLRSSKPEVRRDAALTIGQLKAEAAKAHPNLIEALSDKNSSVRLAAADALVMLGPDAVPLLIETLKDKDFALRQSAIISLGRMGPDGAEAASKLVVLADDPKLARDVQESLLRIGPYAVPGLVQAYESQPSGRVQKTITDVLVKIGPDALERLKTIAAANKKAVAVVNQVVKAAPAPPVDPPVTPLKGTAGLIEADLRAWFNTADRNKDGKLDKAELAMAIRGSGTKTVDFVPVGKNAAAPGPKDFTKLSDAAFLARVDRNGDSVISKNEFEHWAQDYAQYQDELRKTKGDIDAAERRLNETQLTQAMRVQANNAIAASWARYYAVRHQWSHLNHVEWMHRYFVSHAPRVVNVPKGPKGKG